MTPGEQIGLKIDQTLTQDATGTMVMLELEAMGLKKAKTEVSVQYVDHNQIQADFKTLMTTYFYRVLLKNSGYGLADREMGLVMLSIVKNSEFQERHL